MSTRSASEQTSSERSRAPREQKSVIRSFAFAWEGVKFCFATQRHMRVHFAIMALVLFAAWGMRVTPAELFQLLTAMAFVLITELVNTALEYAIDLSTPGYDPRAKVAKDVAAGAVLVAALYSIIVGGLVFGHNPHLAQLWRQLPARQEWPPLAVLQLAIIGLLLLSVLIVALKQVTRRGRFLYGGIVSGHTAFGFFLTTAIALLTRDLSVTALALALALLVSQSRIQARIHSPAEVLLGGLLGIAMACLLFLWPRV